MMNVLTDIVCNTSSLMPSQNFKESFSQSKMISSDDISSKQGPMHILNPVSQLSTMERPLSSVNHSSPSNINLFNSSGHIRLASNVEPAFDDRNDVSVFSDQFPEIVPSWLAHDFMKVSDNLSSPAILSNVSDIYPSTSETEHLEMLDLGFTSELNSQDVVPNGLDRSIDDGQKLLAELPIQRFSNNDPLLMSSFNEMSVTELNTMQYSKFKQNTHHMNSSSPLINSVLPCENDLLHIPLHANLTEQCLTTTSSPSMISNSQSQSHPVDPVCDKLPQINLNNLDSFLGSETALSEIQLLRQDFTGVCMPEVNSNQSNQSCLNNCDPNRHAVSCGTTVFLNSQVTSLRNTQDVSIQVSENVLRENLVENGNCFPCSKVSPEMAIEVTQCFKCKFCDFINIHKCAVESHINTLHSKSLSSLSTVRNEITQSGQRSYVSNSSITVTDPQSSEVYLSKSNSAMSSNANSYNSNSVIHSSRDFALSKNIHCVKCNKVFSENSTYEAHFITDHNINPEIVAFNNGPHNSLDYQSLSMNGILVNSNESSITLTPANNNPYASLNITSRSPKAKPKDSLKKPEDTRKKVAQKKTVSYETSSANSEKQISSHKKAWRRKIRRELGSYICEFKGCNVRFRALDNLEYHRKCHVSGGSNFACPECGMNFENWSSIAGHLWRTHKNDMELHACDQCPFRTYSLSRLENLHKRIHRDEYLFLCDTCGKSFKTGKQLRSHRVIHSKPPKKKDAKSRKPQELKCKICSGQFSSKVLLVHHQEIIHNIKFKRFMCSHCDYTTSKFSTLQLHTRQHTGEKPFKCDQCEYCTADHNSLRRHKMTHSGEKQYKCPYCPYSSIQASTYKSHLKKHPDHNGVMFSCELCSFQTLKKETHVQHMKEHESLNLLRSVNRVTEMNSTEEIFPLVEAMDISLSHGDNYLMPQFSKTKNIQSFLNNLDTNLMVVCQESAT